MLHHRQFNWLMTYLTRHCALSLHIKGALALPRLPQGLRPQSALELAQRQI